MANSVFKILTESEWRSFKAQGAFEGTSLDARDGYIHLSSGEQVDGVIERYFSKIRPLFVLEFSDPQFLEQLQWDEIPSGDVYPHLYNDVLKMKHVAGIREI